MSGENGNKSCDNGGDQEKHADEAGQGSGGSGIVTKFIMIGKCSWILYQEEIPKDAVKLKDEKQK